METDVNLGHPVCRQFSLTREKRFHISVLFPLPFRNKNLVVRSEQPQKHENRNRDRSKKPLSNAVDKSLTTLALEETTAMTLCKTPTLQFSSSNGHRTIITFGRQSTIHYLLKRRNGLRDGRGNVRRNQR